MTDIQSNLDEHGHSPITPASFAEWVNGKMQEQIRPGDFISIAGWRTTGMVLDARYVQGPKCDGYWRVLLQECPNQPDADCKYYNLQPGEWEMAE